MLKVKKLHPEAKLPTKGTSEAAGLDIYALELTELPPSKTTSVRTGIAVAIPDHYFMKFMEKSGIAYRTNLVIRAGVIDSDYRGELKVMYYNASESSAFFQAGEKCVQGVILPVVDMPVQEVNDLDYTERNDKGFGSTGRF